MRAFLDSSAVIDLLDPTGSRHPEAVRSFSGLPHDWCASPLVRMECRVRPLQNSDLLALARLERLFASLLRLSLDDEVFDFAAQLRADHKLKTADALHVATAIFHQCEEFWTNDVRLVKCGAEIKFRSF